MRLTQILCKQHLERMAARHWYRQGNRKILPTKAEECVAAEGYTVEDAEEVFLKRPQPKIDFDLQAVSEKPIPLDERHPDYKKSPCYIYGDSNALLEGLQQAQALTRTVVASEELPEKLLVAADSLKLPPFFHNEVKKKILLSCLLDAEQKKLPVRKDPLRPAWVFPRDYGITDVRKNELLDQNLARICEQHQKSKDITFLSNAKFSLPLNAHGKQMQFELTSELVGVSEKPLSAPKSVNLPEELPNLGPVHCTVSIEPKHFYEIRDHNPIPLGGRWRHVHTALLHYNPTQVQNLYELAVTPTQRDGRLLMKTFCIAASQARALKTKSPLTIQAVQTDGQNFSFGVFTLNTLDVDSDSTEKNFNVLYLAPPLQLYSSCAYDNGRPVLEGYNPAVVERLLAFYANR